MLFLKQNRFPRLKAKKNLHNMYYMYDMKHYTTVALTSFIKQMSLHNNGLFQEHMANRPFRRQFIHGSLTQLNALKKNVIKLSKNVPMRS